MLCSFVRLCEVGPHRQLGNASDNVYSRPPPPERPWFPSPTLLLLSSAGRLAKAVQRAVEKRVRLNTEKKYESRYAPFFTSVFNGEHLPPSNKMLSG